MRRLLKALPWAALGVIMLVALVVGSHRPSGPTSLDTRVRSLAAGIRCPTCQGETAAESQVYAAKVVRADTPTVCRRATRPERSVRTWSAGTAPASLESSPTHGLSALVWILPAVIISAAAVALVVGLRRSRPAPTWALSAEDRALVAAAIEERPPPPVSSSADLAAPPPAAHGDDPSPPGAPVSDNSGHE